jgi:hypothetical protein
MSHEPSVPTATARPHLRPRRDGAQGVRAVGTSDPQRLRWLLVVLCAALALVIAGNSALAIALPDIAADLSADQGELTWIIDAYALAFAALLLPAGIAADRIGRRTMLTAGLVIFGLPVWRRPSHRTPRGSSGCVRWPEWGRRRPSRSPCRL